jgi:hypothetical protein
MKALIQILLAVLAAVSATNLQAQPGSLKKLWESGGVKAPESVVYDADNDVLYVSSVNGPPGAKDGNGFISRMGTDGEMLDAQWITGLDAPKGMAITGGKLYVSDIDTLVEIDIAGGKVSARYPIDGGQFFNDVAAGPDGTVYVSDTGTQTIYRLKDGHMGLWLTDSGLQGPNGLLVERGRLLVASMGPRGETPQGRLYAVSMADKTITAITADPAGVLDGLEADGDSGYYVTDWPAGKLLYITRSGETRDLLDLEQGTADLEYIPAQKMIIIPVMMSNKVVAYLVE